MEAVLLIFVGIFLGIAVFYIISYFAGWRRTPKAITPAPTSHTIITCINVRNNREKSSIFQYVNRDGNSFGLDWYVTKGVINIIQHLDETDDNWESVAVLTEHSIVDVERELFAL